MRWFLGAVFTLLLVAGCLDEVPPPTDTETPSDLPPLALPSKMAWRALTDGPQPRTEVCAAEIGPLFYVIGGYYNPSETSFPGPAGTVPWDEALNTAHARADLYDAEKDSWTMLPDVPVQTIDHCNAVSDDGWVYVLHSGGNWKIRPPENKWIAIAEAPNSHDYGAVGAIGGKIYLTGGGSEDVDMYDPVTDTWTTVGQPMPTGRGHTSGAVVDGKLFVVGGDVGGHDSNTGANEAFDPVTGNWTTYAELPVIRGSLHSVAYRGHIVTMGGQSGGGGGIDSFDDVHAFDPMTNTWTELPRMNHGRHGFGAGVWNDRIYAFHGSPQQGIDATAKADVLEPVG